MNDVTYTSTQVFSMMNTFMSYMVSNWFLSLVFVSFVFSIVFAIYFAVVGSSDKNK